MAKSQFESEFFEVYPDGKAGEPNPDLAFLEEFGIHDAIIMSRWIREVGPEKFVELILGFTQSLDTGRPKTNYSAFLDEFDRIRDETPSIGDYAIADAIARKAFQTNGFKGIRPPATVKAMADAIVKHVQRRKKKPSETKDRKKEGIRDYELKKRVGVRVKALNERATRFLFLEKHLPLVGAFAAAALVVAEKHEAGIESGITTSAAANLIRKT